MYIYLLKAHHIIISIFLLIYVIKTFLLLTNKKESLQKFSSKIKVPDITISFLFLVTGILMILMKENITTFQIIKIIIVLSAIPVAIVGFKKSNKLLAIISLLLIIVSYGLGEINKKRIKKAEVSSDVIANPENTSYNKAIHGAALFDANCAYCHGSDGKGVYGTIDLFASKTDKETMKQIIKEGKKAMPSYKDIMDDVEIDALIEHIETMKK